MPAVPGEQPRSPKVQTQRNIRNQAWGWGTPTCPGFANEILKKNGPAEIPIISLTCQTSNVQVSFDEFSDEVLAVGTFPKHFLQLQDCDLGRWIMDRNYLTIWTLRMGMKPCWNNHWLDFQQGPDCYIAVRSQILHPCLIFFFHFDATQILVLTPSLEHWKPEYGMMWDSKVCHLIQCRVTKFNKINTHGWLHHMKFKWDTVLCRLPGKTLLPTLELPPSL